MSDPNELNSIKDKHHLLSTIVQTHGFDIALAKKEAEHMKSDFSVQLRQVQGDIAHGLDRVTRELSDLTDVACTREMLEASNSLTQEKLDTLGAKVDVLMRAAVWVVITVIGSVIVAVMALVLRGGEFP